MSQKQKKKLDRLEVQRHKHSSKRRKGRDPRRRCIDDLPGFLGHGHSRRL